MKTPLYDAHKTLGAKMVEFGGWLMPVSYSSVLAEHKAVREAVGIFDVSHMGEVIVTGAGAGRFLQAITINDLARLTDGSGQYSAILHPTGGMIDDLIIYRQKADQYFICVNASNADKDYEWIRQQAERHPDVKVVNESPKWGQIAIQGPGSQLAVEALLSATEKAALPSLTYMQMMPVKIAGKAANLARTGYTGEHGYELYVPTDAVVGAWAALLETKARTGVQPIGLGARDTLRLEACYLLYGNDMDDGVSPLEAGIGWATRLEKGDFIGRAPLLEQKARGLTRQLFAFQMEGDGIPRHGMDVLKDGVPIGKVTSGSVLPTVGGAGGMMLVDPRRVAVGDSVEVDVRGKRKLARLAKKPLYKAKVKG